MELEESEVRATGYAAHTLEAALWSFARTDSFRDGCLLTVNLGDDADTTGAVYGQLAGHTTEQAQSPPRGWSASRRRESRLHTPNIRRDPRQHLYPINRTSEQCTPA